MESIAGKTTSEDQKIAKDSLEGFQVVSKKVKSSRNKGVKIKIQENGEFITIPKKAVSLLTTILQNMAEGKSVSVVASVTEVSTQQAADMLHVSRPHVVKLLEAGKIPFKKVGSHRRILVNDIVAYQTLQEEEREKQLEFLAKQAQDLNLGY